MVIFPLAPDQTIAQMWSNRAWGPRMPLNSWVYLTSYGNLSTVRVTIVARIQNPLSSQDEFTQMLHGKISHSNLHWLEYHSTGWRFILRESGQIPSRNLAYNVLIMPWIWSIYCIVPKLQTVKHSKFFDVVTIMAFFFHSYTTTGILKAVMLQLLVFTVE